MDYYNENDRSAAAWLRELIKAGEIPPGTVDERSILEIKPDELKSYTQCHFFAGIGGWSLALKLAGWPAERPVWTGSCPCQPLSCAGQRKGHADERHLWPAFYELISQRRPATVFGEQVAGRDGREWLAGIRADLEGIGYAVGAADLCAAGVGAPHIRQRLYWLADDESQRRKWGQVTTQQAGRIVAEVSRATGGLADVQRPRLEGLARDEHHRGQPGRNGTDAARPVAESGAVGGVADPEHTERGAFDGPGEDERHGNDSRRQEAHSQSGARGEVLAGFWSDFDLIPCSDGKARRVKSGLQCLADGVPGRVGLLRGYGNAIVPPVAAAFVKAAL